MNTLELEEVLLEPNYSENEKQTALRELEYIAAEGRPTDQQAANEILFRYHTSNASALTKQVLEVSGTDSLSKEFWQKVYQFLAEKQIDRDAQEKVLRELGVNPDLSKLLAHE